MPTVIELGNPEEIIGFVPNRYDESFIFEAGEHNVDVTYHFIVPADKKYRVHMVIDVTGVLGKDEVPPEG